MIGINAWLLILRKDFFPSTQSLEKYEGEWIFFFPSPFHLRTLAYDERGSFNLNSPSTAAQGLCTYKSIKTSYATIHQWKPFKSSF